MKRFSHLGQRVTVVSGEFTGRTGTVQRLLRRDHSAWVRMDEDIPNHARKFPADDPVGRGNDVVLWPEECEPLKAGAKR